MRYEDSIGCLINNARLSNKAYSLKSLFFFRAIV